MTNHCHCESTQWSQKQRLLGINKKSHSIPFTSSASTFRKTKDITMFSNNHSLRLHGENFQKITES